MDEHIFVDLTAYNVWQVNAKKKKKKKNGELTTDKTLRSSDEMP